MKKQIVALLMAFALVLCVGCGEPTNVSGDIPLNIVDDSFNTYYEVFVYSFCDSNGDRIGDFQGLISKLDYLNDGDDSTDTDLGVDGIWLMPITKSTTYHKYDVVDYMDVDPEYGTMADFDMLIEECGKRGIDVIIDLVINHSSSANKWFIEAREYIGKCISEGKEPSADECKYFGYYNFSTEPASGYRSLVGNWYYEAQFDERMPDLNLANEDLRKEIGDIVQFWFDKGVAGFRLDATGEYYSGNNAKNIEALTWFADMVKQKKPDAYLVGECWQGESTYVSYYKSRTDSFFDFSGASAEGVLAKTAKVKSKSNTAKAYVERSISIQKSILENNPNGINASFLSNHDQDRVAGFFSGDYAECELKMAAALNLFSWGNSFIYYGEEIGMKGSGTDPNRRAPMYWDSNSSAEGMCKGPVDMKGVKQKYPSVVEQTDDENSILSFYRDAIRLKNQNPEIARGIIENIDECSTDYVAALKKTWNGSEVVLIINIGPDASSVDISGVTINGKPAEEASVRGWLYAGNEKGSKKGTVKKNKVTVPGFSIVVLK